MIEADKIYHISPNNDLKPHLLNMDLGCQCNPEIREENGFLFVIHNSYDGREGLEWARDILNETD